MTIKIHRILKSDLSQDVTINANLASLSTTSSMTISHYAYAPQQSGVTIPYSLEIVGEHVPKITEIDFCVVIRKKVDLTAPGVNEQRIEGLGDDVGEYEYVKSVPSRPRDLPPGFQELYHG